MKRTPIKRKTPLKAKTPIKAKTPLKVHKPLRPKVEPGKYSTLNAAHPSQSRKSKKPTKRSSMSGAGRTVADIALHGAMIAIGCMACHIAGRKSAHKLQIHHPEGRNTGRAGDFSEQYCIPLCAEHHDQRIYWGFFRGDERVHVDPDIPSVHHAKKDFIARYGSEALLVHLSYERLRRCPVWLSEQEWLDWLALDCMEAREAMLSILLAPDQIKARRALGS